jgi:hypothetical protein
MGYASLAAHLQLSSAQVQTVEEKNAQFQLGTPLGRDPGGGRRRVRPLTRLIAGDDLPKHWRRFQLRE